MTLIVPKTALSVRQPWAWAILHGGKVIENRSMGAIRAGRMKPGLIALHAALGMKEAEYRYGAWRLQKHGVRCPAPADLVRGAIIGVVKVTGIITESDSEWFGGPRSSSEAVAQDYQAPRSSSEAVAQNKQATGLTLADPVPVAPIPAKGALGYFQWEPSGTLAEPAAWMRKYAPEPGTTDLFPDADLAFRTPPSKPWSGNG